MKKRSSIIVTIVLLMLSSQLSGATNNCQSLFNFETSATKQVQINEETQLTGEIFLNKIKNNFKGLYQKLINDKTQLMHLKRSLKTLNHSINKDFSPKNLDKYVFDLYGHLNLGLQASSLRPWNKKKDPIETAKPDDVIGITPSLWAKIAEIAERIEKPINAYSDNSGESLRAVSPQAARFMGKTQEEAQALIKILTRKSGLSNKQLRDEAHKIPTEQYCKTPWCYEEARHEGILAKLASRVYPERKIDDRVEFDAYEGLSSLSVKDAYFHLMARMDTEWHAASAYYFLEVHSKGTTNRWMSEVRTDEVKHQAVFGGLYKYLRGDDYNSRLLGMLKKAIAEAREKNKSTQFDLKSEYLTVLEFLYIHTKYETHIRRYFKSLPVKSLRKIYETEINLPQLSAESMDPVKKRKLDKLIKSRTIIRKQLGDWKTNQKENIEKLEEFEKKYNDLITIIIEKKFRYYKDAETYGNAADIKIKRQISQINPSEVHMEHGFYLNKKEMLLLKKSLYDNLRDYQIFNNETVRQEGLEVKFINALTGFNVTPKEKTINLKVLSLEPVTDRHTLLRLTRPPLLALTAGDTLLVSIKDSNGNIQSRALSLTSSPNEQYLEVAVTNSNSAFKKLFLNLQPGDSVSVKRLTKHAGLKYNKQRPAVMFAGGIGVTPMRCIIKQVRDIGEFEQPISLLLSGKNEVPFMSEFSNIGKAHENFDVTFYMTGNSLKRKQKDNIVLGRINETAIELAVKSNPKNTVFYVVAPNGMQKTVLQSLENLGVSRERISTELFTTPLETINKFSDTDANGKDKSEIICACMGVSKKEIQQAAISQQETEAGTGCGSCKDKVNRVTKEALESKK